MKKLLLFILSIFALHCNAQNVSLDWVKTWGGSSTETASILRNDSEGNIYMVGKFSGTMDFDPGAGVVNKTSNGGFDIYILKLNSVGAFLWVKTFGNASNDIVEHAEVDQLDNILLTGRFVDSIDFDPSSAVDTKTSNGFSDVYILKLSDTGNYLWSKTFGASKHETSRGLAINSSNEIAIAGRFLDTVDFDPGPGVANKVALTVDIYLLKLSASGNFIWVKTLEGPVNSSVQVNDILFDQNDNLLMNASYKDSIDVDPSSATHFLTDPASPLQFNLFILKLNSSGNFLWAKQFENTVGNSVGISKLAHDSVGNYYLGGFFYGNIDFDLGAGTFNIVTPRPASYILKMDSNANFIWAKHMGGFSGQSPEYETVFEIAIDVLSNVYLCGSFKGYEDFDPGPGVFYLGVPNHNSHVHAYIMKLDNAGNLGWAKNIGYQPSAASANSIILNHAGDLYVAGDFFDHTDFDFNSGVHNILPQGNWDAYVLKIKNCVNSTTTDIINSCAPITWINGQTYTATNFTAKDTISTADGCDSIITLNFTLNSIDTTITKSGNTLISNATGVNYQWVNCDNNYTALSGQTNSSFTPTTNGSYAVILNNGSCIDTSHCYSFTVLSTDNIVHAETAVYPNPTNGLIHIENQGEAITFRLYNNIGQLVYEGKTSADKNKSSFEINNTPIGMYIYTLTTKFQTIGRGKMIID